MKHTSTWLTVLSSTQWLFFIFANIVVVPISIGSAFDLSVQEIAGTLRSSLVFTGLACLLQGLWGHRFPLMEGHSGLMWGLVLSLAGSASSLGMSGADIGGGIATGMLLAGALTVVLASLNLLKFLDKVFSPLVMSVYLFLLTFQLTLIFFRGMIHVSADGSMDIPVTAFSCGIALLVILVKVWGNRFWGNFSILIGMFVGWSLFYAWFPAESSQSEATASLVLFPLGEPNLNAGIILTTFLASFINLSNNLASIRTAAAVLKEPIGETRVRRSLIFTGTFSIGASILGLVSYAPFASSIGFLESTRTFERRPFLIGGGLLVMLGLVPALGNLMATLPGTVGNAVLFAAYLQLLGTSLKSIQGYLINSVTIHRLALPVLLGLGIMNLDADLFRGLPTLLQPLLSNGFIMGVLVSILLEHLIDWKRRGEGAS